MTSGPGSGLSPLEVASGLVFGSEPTEGARRASVSTPLEALEGAVLPALLRPPCLVSFSGGRDSSAVLAVATTVALREGLASPIPATLRFPGVAEADESSWQEDIIRSLGLADWIRFEPGDELDVVGPIATRVLLRHGLLWPFNAHFHVPLLEAAAGGSLLTGYGGDEMFGTTTWDRVNLVLARRVRPVPKDLARVPVALAPWRVRRAVLRRRFPLPLPWLRRWAREGVAKDWATEAAQEPRRYAERPAWWLRSRAARLVHRSLSLIAADAGALLVHPFAHVSLADAIARTPSLALARRSDRLRIALGDVLPVSLYERRTKASFDRVFWGPHARALAASWQEAGIDTGVVDPDGLRAAWAQETAPPHTYTLLQATWLDRATEARREGAEPPARGTTTDAAGAARKPAEQQA